MLGAKVKADLDAFEHRKRYDELTPEVLTTIPDAEVEQAILDLIDCRLEATKHSEQEELRELPQGFSIVYTTWWVEAEVNNGGFNQYFWNPSGEFASEALAGFEAIGSLPLAGLMKRAIAVRDEDQVRMKAFKVRGSLEAFSELHENNRLDELDDSFYELGGEASAERIRFIRSNPELFRAKCRAG